jgi:hypothetical protein
MSISYFGLVIMIYAYFNKNIKQLNEFLKINFKQFQMWNKEFGIDFKKKIYNFQRIIYHTKKREKEIILNDYMQNLYFVFDEI